MSALDLAKDPVQETLAVLAKEGTNARLREALGGDPVKNAFGAPLPISLLTAKALPCVCVYRLEDRDQDKGDWAFQHVTTWRFDYFSTAVPVSRIDRRWPLLQQVWFAMLASIRDDRVPGINDCKPLESGRYVLGTARVQYTFVPGADSTYPSFRGQLQIERAYDEPTCYTGKALADFDTLWTDWNIQPDDNLEVEASDEIKPNG